MERLETAVVVVDMMELELLESVVGRSELMEPVVDRKELNAAAGEKEPMESAVAGKMERFHFAVGETGSVAVEPHRRKRKLEPVVGTMEPLGPIVVDKMGPMGFVAGGMDLLGSAVGRLGLPEKVVGKTERQGSAVVRMMELEPLGPVAGMMVTGKLVAGTTVPLEDIAVAEMGLMEQVVGRMERLRLAVGTVLELVAEVADKKEQVVGRLEELLGLVAGRTDRKVKQLVVDGLVLYLMNNKFYSLLVKFNVKMNKHIRKFTNVFL